MHIGLLGGTFNPIHICHLRIAEQTQARLNLDRIIFIPSGDPPHKSSTSLIPARHRLAMVHMALASYPTFTVSEIEIQSTGISYTVDSVRFLKKELPAGVELFFIVGLDAFLEFSSWKETSSLIQLCNFVVCSRPGTNFRELASVTGPWALSSCDLDSLDTGKADHAEFPLSPTTRLTLLRLPPCEISASMIRRNLIQGKSASHWLPPPVESYIIQSHLFPCPNQ